MTAFAFRMYVLLFRSYKKKQNLAPKSHENTHFYIKNSKKNFQRKEGELGRTLLSTNEKNIHACVHAMDRHFKHVSASS